MTMRTSANLISGRALRHAPVWLGMAAVAAVSWFLLVQMDAGMSAMSSNGMVEDSIAMGAGGPGLGLFLATFAMWAVMMVAMMLPAVVPSATLFSTLAASRHAPSSNLTTTMYIAGYTACWLLFAAPAAALQSALTNSALIDAMGQSTNALLSAVILLAAGLYQFSPLKTACLAKCRSPLAYFMAQWRDGAGGALMLGIRHGGYCVGCCWALMAVMFVVGAMNLVWMGSLTFLVLSEKVVPPAWRIDRITGVALVISGLWMGALALLAH
jgi:predicted metal-binding membrane protein